MKKNSKTPGKGSLKKIKEEISSLMNQHKYEDAITICERLINLFPKNAYGYVSLINAYTHEYNKYLSIKELKRIKKTYEIAYELSSKKEKLKLKQSFDDYLYDIKEVENLKKIKKEIISKEFYKSVYDDTVTFINQNLNAVRLYGKTGVKIKNFYDFLKGLFLFSCLIYNLTFCNYLLFLTIPFGIFGFINMYSFIEMNFFAKGKFKLEKETYEKIINDANLRVSNIKKEINKLIDNISFLREQKALSVSRIPELFFKDIEEIVKYDEKNVSKQILESFLSSDIVRFTYLLEENTNLNPDEVIKNLSQYVDNKEDALSKYIIDKSNEKKNNQSKALLMKKISPINIVFLIIALFISFSTIFILIDNFYEMNLTSFIAAIIIGVLTMLIYNINTGKHSSLNDTFNDNLFITVFNATIIYDLIYSKINNGLSITYGFLQIPITLVLVFMGFVMFVSILKYSYLLKKLRS